MHEAVVMRKVVKVCNGSHCQQERGIIKDPYRIAKWCAKGPVVFANHNFIALAISTVVSFAPVAFNHYDKRNTQFHNLENKTIRNEN